MHALREKVQQYAQHDQFVLIIDHGKMVNPFVVHQGTGRSQVFGGRAGRGTGLHHRLGNVLGTFKGAAYKNAGPGSLHRFKAAGLRQLVLVKFDVQSLGQLNRILGLGKPNRQHHHVKLFFLDALIKGGIAEGDILALRDLPSDGDVAADEPHIGKVFRSLIEPLEVLTEGTDIVVKDRRLHFGVMILGQDHLLLGVGAANRRTVAFAVSGDPS